MKKRYLLIILFMNGFLHSAQKIAQSTSIQTTNKSIGFLESILPIRALQDHILRYLREEIPLLTSILPIIDLQHLVLDYLDSVEEELLSTGLYRWRSLAFFADKNYLAYGCAKDIEISCLNKNEYKKLTGHTDTVSGLAFSRDGKYLASGSFDTTIKIWKQNNNQWDCTQTLIGSDSSVLAVAFSSDAQCLVSGSRKNIKIWQLKSNQWNCIQTLTDHTDIVNSVAFSPDGKYLASASRDKAIKLWHCEHNQWQCVQTLIDDYSIKSVAFSPDGKYLATSVIDISSNIKNDTYSSLKLWRLKNNQLECIRTINNGCFWLVFAILSNGRYLIQKDDGDIGVVSGGLSLWILKDQKFEILAQNK